MDAALFGTDGIRGPAGEYPLTQDSVRQIGRAIGTYFARPGQLIPVGRDPRESSPELAQAIIDGLVAAGVHATDIGIIPTPGLAFLTTQQQAAVGVMITASHNPYTDNGIKVFTGQGRKLTDEAQEGLNSQITADFADRPGGMRITHKDAVGNYHAFLVAAAHGTSLQGFKLAVDSANGATSGLAQEVFKTLGAAVTPLFDQPDGRNINVQCGATDPAALQAAVTSQGLDAGVAFDGDGDRVVLADERGRLLTGDHILYILAITGGQTAIAATQMSNMGLEQALQARGIELVRTAVGDRYVLQALTERHLQLGGEQSGHIILMDYSPTGDGLLAAIVTLCRVQASGRTLAQWYDELSLLPQTIVNVPLQDKSLLQHADAQAYIGAVTKQLGNTGRLNIRASGTEPKARIMVEAADAETRAQAIADGLSQVLQSLAERKS